MIVGSDNVVAIEKFFLKYMRELGSEVSLFSAQSIFYDYYFKNVLHKVIFRAGASSIHKTINKKFKEAVNNFKPEVIWVFKGMEITPETLCWAKELGIKLVNYNPDNPFIFSGIGSGNRNITESISLYDLHLTYNLSVKERLEHDFKMPVELLPFGFDLEEKLFNECARQKEILKACFLGNPDSQRASFIVQLAEADIPIDVYGSRWDKQLDHPNITIHSPVYLNDFWKTLRKYRVQLNLMRLHNPDSHNMRSFEIPGVGGIMLAPDTPDHRMFFEEGKELFLYNDVETCIAAINSLLNFSEANANYIREQARAKSLANGYTYKDRSKQALDAIRKIAYVNEERV